MDFGGSKFFHFTAQQKQELIEAFASIPLVVNANGTVQFSPALPTSEPATVGSLWNNANVLTVSNGP